MATGRLGNMGAKPQGKNGFAFAQSGFSRSSSGDPITPLSQAETNLEKGRIVMRTVKIIGLIVAGMLAISSTALAGGHGGGGHGGGRDFGGGDLARGQFAGRHFAGGHFGAGITLADVSVGTADAMGGAADIGMAAH